MKVEIIQTIKYPKKKKIADFLSTDKKRSLKKVRSIDQVFLLNRTIRKRD